MVAHIYRSVTNLVFIICCFVVKGCLLIVPPNAVLWGRVFQFSFRKTKPLKVRKCQKINFPHDTPTKSVVMETRHNPKSPLLSFTVSFSHIETLQYRIGQNTKATRRIFYLNKENGRFLRRKIAWSSFLKAVQIWSWKLNLEIITTPNQVVLGEDGIYGIWFW